MVLFSKQVGFADPGLSSDLLLSLARGHAVFGVRRANRYAFECAVEGFFLYLSKFFCILQSLRGWALSFRLQDGLTSWLGSKLQITGWLVHCVGTWISLDLQAFTLAQFPIENISCQDCLYAGFQQGEWMTRVRSQCV